MTGATGAARRLLWAALAASALGAVTLVGVPVVLLHPFRPQTPFGVALAYELRRLAPAATLVLLGLALAALVALARGLRRRWQWAPLVLLLAPTLGACWFAWQNHFEWMFRPILDPAWAKVKDARFVADADMVIAVEVRGDAVAYPVRQMAYHHLLNDVVGGLPVVSTY